MRAFEHVEVTSVEEAVGLLRGEKDSAIIAGGTDLLVLMKNRLANPRLLVNVKTIGGLGRLHADGAGGLSIGSLVSMAALGENQLVRKGFSILADAIRVAASSQLRNMATVGGNLCQRPRCWYYRGPFECFLKGGDACLTVGGNNRDAGIFGGAECYSVNPSDLAPPLVALGAAMVVQGPKGRRQIPAESFFTAPKKGVAALNALGRDEMIVQMVVPRQPDSSRGIYLKAMERKAWSFAQASVAVQLCRSGEAVQDVKIVLGGVAPIPWRSRAAEDVLRGKVPTTELIEDAANAAVQDARPLDQNRYKVALVRGLVRRGLSAVLVPGAS